MSAKRVKSSKHVIKLNDDLAIDLEDPKVLEDGIRAWVCGEPGSGKSNTVMLLGSQWLKAGRQLIVLDVHEEYGNLWSAAAPGAVESIGYTNEPVTEDSVDWLMGLVAEGRSLLVNLNHWYALHPEKVHSFVNDFMRALYEYIVKNPRQMLVVLEEAQEFAPQAVQSTNYGLVQQFIKMLSGGRKFGLNFVLASQRQALVDSNAIALCNVRFFMRVSERKDWKAMKPYVEGLPVTFSDGAAEKKSRGGTTTFNVAAFDSGQCVLVNRWLGAQVAQLDKSDVPVRRFL